jgi:hypothetical protein
MSITSWRWYNFCTKEINKHIYIYKEECLFVCLFVCSLCVWRPYEQMQPNFPETIFTSRGRSTSTFFPKKINPPLATGAPMQLTNRITVSIYIKKNVCLSVCLFVMHSVPVIAIVTKLSTIFP